MTHHTSYSVGDETQDELDAIETDIRGMRLQDHHRAKLGRQFREDQERIRLKDNHHKAMKRAHKSKRGFKR